MLVGFGEKYYMYVEENTIKRSNSPSEINWLKKLIITGSIIIGISHLFLIVYSIIQIIFLYVNIELVTLSIGSIGTIIYNSLLTIGMIIISIGFIGTSRLVEGSAKITLLIGAVILFLLTFVNIIFAILGTILIMFNTNVLVYGIISYTYWTVKMLFVIIVQFVVNFTKNKLVEGEGTINLKTISAFILPVWIPVIATSLVLTFINFSTLSGLFVFIGFLCLSINQIIYAIEFSIKVGRT